MKQSTLVVVTVVIVLVAVAVGFFGGQAFNSPSGPSAQDLAALGTQVNQLQQQVKALSEQLTTAKQSTSAPAAFRVAYVDMFKVLSKYKGTQEPLAKFQQLEKATKQKLQDLAKQFQAGQLTKSEYDQQVNELKLKLNQANLQLSAPIQQKIIAVVKELGKKLGYALIIDNEASQAQASVLYNKKGMADDITDQVIAQINAGQPAGNSGK